MLRDPAVALEDEGARHDVVEEVAVVADQQQRAGVVHQQLLQDVERVGVEVVGRLVEHQDVGRLGEELGQQEAVALAAGEHARRGARARGFEEEVLEVADDVPAAALHLQAVVAARDVLRDRLGVVDRRPHLVEVGHLELGPELDRALGGRELAEQELDERRLARAVGADEADLVAAAQDEVEPADDGRLAGIGEAEGLRLDHPDARDLARGEAHLGHAVGLAPGAALAAHLAEGLHAGLRALALGAGAAARPRLLLRELLLEGRAPLALGLLGLDLAGEVGVVVAGPVGQLPAVELDDARGHAAEEGAVVGDEEDRHLRLQEEILHPEDRLQVEVVGGLVQEQQLGLGREGAGEEGAAAQASGEVEVGAVLGKPEAGDEVVDPQVALPILLRAVLRPEPGGDELAHRQGDVLGDLLGQQGLPGGAADLAAVGAHLAGGDSEEGGLAGAVAPDEADALALLDLQVDPVEDGRPAEGEVDVEQGEQGHSEGGRRKRGKEGGREGK